MTSSVLAAVDACLTGQRVRIDVDQAVLVGSRCEDCGWESWPPRAGCPQCLGVHIASTTLSHEGLLLTWTRVWVGVESVTPPYVLGLVRLGGVRVFAQVRDLPEDARMPIGVRLGVADPGAVPPFWFEPSSHQTPP